MKTEVRFQQTRGNGTWLSWPTRQARVICDSGNFRRTSFVGNAIRSSTHGLLYRAAIRAGGKSIAGYLAQHPDGLHFHEYGTGPHGDIQPLAV